MSGFLGHIARDQSGETLVETLVALVVVIFAVVVLVSATVAAATMNRQAQDRHDALQAEQVAAEGGTGDPYSPGSGSAPTVTMTDSGGTVTYYTVKVDYHGGEDLVSYDVTSSSPGSGA